MNDLDAADLVGFAAAPLDQDALDAMFSFGADAGPAKPARGVDALLQVAAANAERLPLLEVLFERVVRTLSTALRNFTSDAVEVTLERFETQRFEDYSNGLPLPLVIGVFRAEQWDNLGLLAIDSPLVFALVDALMGGRRGMPAFKIDGRPFTTLELRFVERAMDVILRELTASFEPISPVNFRLDRMETSPRFAAIARPTSAVAVARLRVDMDERGGRFSIMLPYSTLEPIRKLLVQRFMGEKLGRDTAWDMNLAAAVDPVPIEVAAVIAERTMPLGEAMELQVGQTIRFEQHAGREVALRAEGMPLLSGELFQSANQYVVRAEAPPMGERERGD